MRQHRNRVVGFQLPLGSPRGAILWDRRTQLVFGLWLEQCHVWFVVANWKRTGEYYVAFPKVPERTTTPRETRTREATLGAKAEAREKAAPLAALVLTLDIRRTLAREQCPVTWSLERLAQVFPEQPPPLPSRRRSNPAREGLREAAALPGGGAAPVRVIYRPAKGVRTVTSK